MNQLQPALAALADAADLVVGQGRVAAIDVADHVGVCLQHHVLVDQPGTGDRGAAGVDGALDAIFARPADHLARGGAVLDAAETDFAEQFDAGSGELLEVVLDHFVFDDGRAGMNLHAAGAERPERALGENRHRLDADHVAGTAGHVNFAGGNHRGDAAVEIAVDPADLVLPWRPVARDGMNMAVDQAGRDRGAVGIDCRGGVLGVDVLEAPDRGDLAILGHDRIRIEDRLLQSAGEQQPDIADYQLARAGRLGCIVGHGLSFLFNAFAGRWTASCPRLDAGIKLDYSFVYE